jgi:hypothetical protein
MLDAHGHHIRAGQIRVAFHDLGQMNERAEAFLVLRAPAVPQFVAVVSGLDRQHYNWTAEAIEGTWLIGYEIGSPGDDGPAAAALHALPGTGFPSPRPRIEIEAMRVPSGSWDTIQMRNRLGEAVLAVQQVAHYRAGYVFQTIPDARPASHRSCVTEHGPCGPNCPMAPADPLADPRKRAAYYGTNPEGVEPRPSRRQCGTCRGTGGDSVGAQCRSCRGYGTIAL